MAAPWLALLIAGWIEQRAPGWRRTLWSVALVSAICVAGQTLAWTHNAGWPAVVRPEKSATSYVYLAWRAWLTELPSAGGTLHVALPFNREIAPFYRRSTPQKINLVPLATLAARSAEETVADLRGEWLITTPQAFAGREGNVVRRTWFFQGDAASVYSLVAYRATHAGEAANPGGIGR